MKCIVFHLDSSATYCRGVFGRLKENGLWWALDKFGKMEHLSLVDKYHEDKSCRSNFQLALMVA